ncbi:MAG: hypothetical protein ACRELF_27315, partial [Gemmataceae bacterium]
LGHTIKGALGHLGIPVAQEAALRLEMLPDDCQGHEASGACSSLLAETQRILPRLEAAVRSPA